MKIEFSKGSNDYSTYGRDEIVHDLYSSGKFSYIKIFLIEIGDSINPASLSLEITWHANIYIRRHIAFSRLRTKFIHQQNHYLLDTSDLKHFDINLSEGQDFTIKAIAENDLPFFMRLYLETDQPHPAKYNEFL